jgi:hypothetical protein
MGATDAQPNRSASSLVDSDGDSQSSHRNGHLLPGRGRLHFRVRRSGRRSFVIPWIRPTEPIHLAGTDVAAARLDPARRSRVIGAVARASGIPRRGR